MSSLIFRPHRSITHCEVGCLKKWDGGDHDAVEHKGAGLSFLRFSHLCGRRRVFKNERYVVSQERGTRSRSVCLLRTGYATEHLQQTSNGDGVRSGLLIFSHRRSCSIICGAGMRLRKKIKMATDPSLVGATNVPASANVVAPVRGIMRCMG